jgi:Spy/CpxP family protein refolding chaperone
MNRWIARVVTVASVVGMLSVGVGGIALANEQGSGEHGKGWHHHHEGLVHEALKLDSLKAEQRTQIEQLESARHTAEVPVMQANAVVLTQLAKQVEQDHIDRTGLKDSLTAEESAAQAARTVDVNTLAQLHGVLSAQQRNQLVDALEARIPADRPRPAHLEAFRGDIFDANAMSQVHVPGERAIAMAEKRVPSMSPQQRAEFAGKLRERAAHQAKG